MLNYPACKELMLHAADMYQQLILLSMLNVTLQPLYNTVRYNTVLDIIWFKDGSQKCIDYI